jgi:hypothetical protein
VGASEIRTLLGARASFVCSEETLRGAVEPIGRAGEVWVVAGRHGARAATRLGASTVDVEDVIDPGVRELLVRVHAPGRRDVGLTLPLPNDAACLRVLRDPFPRAVLPTVRRKARAPLAVARPVISPATPNVCARLADGGLLVLPLPRSKRQDIGNGRILHVEGAGEIVAAGHAGGKPAAIAQHGYDLTLVSWRGKRGVTRRIGSSHEALRPPPLDGRLFPLVTVGAAVLFVGRGGRLLEFRPGNRARVVALDCCALIAFSSGAITFAVSGDSRTDLTTVRDAAQLAPSWIGIPADAAMLAPTSLGGVAAAFESRDGTWTAAAIEPHAMGLRASHSGRLPVLDPENPTPGVHFARVEVPRSSEVVGVLDHLRQDGDDAARTGRYVSSPGLLLLEEDGRQLRVTTGGAGPEFSIALPGRAVHAVLDATTRVAVCVTDEAELLIVSLAWRSVFARFSGQGRVS